MTQQDRGLMSASGPNSRLEPRRALKQHVGERRYESEQLVQDPAEQHGLLGRCHVVETAMRSRLVRGTSSGGDDLAPCAHRRGAEHAVRLS